MQPFTTHEGIVAPLPRADVDTDQIIPKQFLKRVERTGYGQFLFFDWRFHPDGTPNPEFILEQPPFHQATILLAGANFGCGSSREHAPWALIDFGFRAVLAPSFADIFYNNCFKNGLLPITLAHSVLDQLFQQVAAEPGISFAIDLAARTVVVQNGPTFHFEIDPFRADCLLRGLDDIGLTLEHEAKIAAYEAAQPQRTPNAPV